MLIGFKRGEGGSDGGGRGIKGASNIIGDPSGCGTSSPSWYGGISRLASSVISPGVANSL